MVGNELRRGSENFRHRDIQCADVGQKCLRIKFRNFKHGLVFPLRALLQLVFPFVGIACEVADVRDIHHALHAIAVRLKHALKDVFKHVCAQIPDVRIVVDRRPAGIEPHRCFLQGLEDFQFAPEGVIEAEHCSIVHGKGRERQSGENEPQIKFL